MFGKIHLYQRLVIEVDLDAYAHVNNTTYFTMFEEARWDLISENGYGFHKIMETGLGPVILEVTARYLKELQVRDKIIIETSLTSYEKKVGKMVQRMLRGEDVCCIAEFTFGLFDLKQRKLVLPTQEWLKGLGLD